MKPHHSSATDPVGDETQWPKRDTPGDSRGLPGYPRDGDGDGDRDGAREQGKVDPELGFDPDSPDLADPQIDPPGAPRVPDAPEVDDQRRAPGEQYPPYSKP